jgi:hypothetical protein
MKKEALLLIEILKNEINPVEFPRKYFDLNWPLFLSISNKHAVQTFLFKIISQSGLVSLFPEEVITKLRFAYHNNYKKNFFIHNNLFKIIDALSRKSIDVMLLKGTALIQVLYNDYGLRPMRDVDILVSKGQFHESLRILKELNFEVDERSQSQDFYLQYFYHLALTNNLNIVIELHWNLTEPWNFFQIENSLLWESAKTAKFFEQEAKIPSIEHLILHICLQNVDEKFSKLQRLYDVHNLISNKTIDWDFLEKISDQASAHEVVKWNLELCQRFFDTWIENNPFKKRKTNIFSYHGLNSIKFEEKIIDQVIPKRSYLQALILFLLLPDLKLKFKFIKSRFWRDESYYPMKFGKKKSEIPIFKKIFPFWRSLFSAFKGLIYQIFCLIFSRIKR